MLHLHIGKTHRQTTAEIYFPEPIHRIVMRLAVLSGGTGTPKLLWGMREILPDEDVSVVVNTAEDIWISGNHISPDVDTVMYLYAGILNTATWWGILGDTFRTHDILHQHGSREYIAIGDQDRAVQILRADMLRSGSSLTECTRSLCRQFGAKANILPMTDTPVTTFVETDNGTLHFQEYWVKHRGKEPIRGVFRSSSAPPCATAAVVSALWEAEAILIGPSNPVTSIAPILECAGVCEILREKFVLAISPFIGNSPVSGPAAALMRAWGRRADSAGTAALYRDCIDLFVQDVRDPVPVEGSIRLDTLMSTREKSISLSRAVFTILKDNL